VLPVMGLDENKTLLPLWNAWCNVRSLQTMNQEYRRLGAIPFTAICDLSLTKLFDASPSWSYAVKAIDWPLGCSKTDFIHTYHKALK
jgi:hypothetical protein